ncbi:MAG: Abi family protein [Eubacterium sp.]|nr:Abi family protein [Eubacterium sp.]
MKSKSYQPRELKEHQPPLTIDEQINNLKRIGLIIEDEEYARDILNDISYFRLIKAYGLGLKPRNGKYFEGVNFDQIVELYLFNANFRQLIFAQIERVEVNLRCRVANYFSCEHGIFGYMDENNFQDSNRHQEFLKDVEEELSRNSRSPFVKNFQKNYIGGNLPLYAIVELISFGTLSKFYKNMKNSDKKAIANMYGIGFTYLESWFEHISYVRNICAHYGRLYNAVLVKRPMLYSQDTMENADNSRIFTTLLCLKRLIINDEHWEKFVTQISQLLKKYPHVNIKLMEFPENWDELLIPSKETAKIG